MTALTPPDIGLVIDLEAKHPGGHNGHKEQAMRDQLDLNPSAYYRRLGQILDTPDLLTVALQHDPSTTNRLRAARALRMSR